MADNKLNLFVKITGVDKLSGSIKNMIGTSRTGQRSIRDMQREVKLMEKDLGRVRRELSSGSVKGGLIMAERERADAIGKTNREIDRQKRKLERVTNIRSRAGAVAGMAGRAGAAASVAITAPLVALSASVGRLAQDAKGMRNAANVAGMGFEQFQRDAYAARSVGIEYEKLGDILKDTQDKIGDFAANEGGEMADFFKNVARKVGVAAKSFQNLSGSQALQLYYDSLVKAGVSQKEMVFYMEAIADEGSGLIPILANNGKAMKELGSQAAVISAKDAKGLKEYTDAQRRLGNATTRLQIALARSGLIDTMVWIADKGAAAASWFGTLSPGVQKVAVVLGMVAAAAGPVLIFFGAVASAVATLAPVFATVGAVIGGIPLVIALVAAGLAALAYTVYANWDAIKGALQAGWAATSTRASVSASNADVAGPCAPSAGWRAPSPELAPWRSLPLPPPPVRHRNRRARSKSTSTSSRGRIAKRSPAASPSWSRRRSSKKPCAAMGTNSDARRPRHVRLRDRHRPVRPHG